MAVTNARLLGALIGNLSPEVATGLIKSRVLTTHFTKASVFALNAVLLTSPEALADNLADETVAVICQGIAHRVSYPVPHPFPIILIVLSATRDFRQLCFSRW